MSEHYSSENEVLPANVFPFNVVFSCSAECQKFNINIIRNGIGGIIEKTPFLLPFH
ncbi:MAG: hypothetical protein ACJ706_00795 [Nitrososphaeraceae archaeon]